MLNKNGVQEETLDVAAASVFPQRTLYWLKYLGEKNDYAWPLSETQNLVGVS